MLGETLLIVFPRVQISRGDVSPCPIGIDALDVDTDIDIENAAE